MNPDSTLDLSRINTNLLVALDLLLSEESVTRAADRQGVTPSAMSHALRSLRELFDDPLLVRAGNNMTPTPLAEKLRRPLRMALRDLERTISSGIDFVPATARRSFVVLAPDFLSTLILPSIATILVEEAPGIEIEVRPVRRRGSSLRLADTEALAEGDVDVVLAALAVDESRLHREMLYPERFVCLVRDDHPTVGESLDLETYVATPQALITITDERTPTWIDEALAGHGLERRIAVRTRFFISAALLVSESDLLLTCPFQLARYFVDRLPVRIVEPPLQLPTYEEFMVWHPRFDADPGSRWLRSVVRQAVRDLVER